MSILNEKPKESLKTFLNRCSTVCDLDIEKAYIVTCNVLKNHKSKDIPFEDIEPWKKLETIWYDSLESGTPDYSVYSDPYYFTEAWLCWIAASRSYLKSIISDKSMFGKSIVSDIGNINNVLDLGCGFAYSTIALKEFFPTANVIGTNIENSYQFKLAKELGKQYDFTIQEDYKIKADLIFASEYFEHFDRPIEHLIDIIKHCNPKYLIIANGFGYKAMGHFDTYYHKEQSYTAKEMRGLFNTYLKSLGYTKQKTKCWFDNPEYWKKIENLDSFF